MADYYPLIARAVAGLSEPTPETRAAIYERARTALIGQLRSLDPPLSEAEIEREREGLEAAFARIEAEQTAPAPTRPASPERAAGGTAIAASADKLRTRRSRREPAAEAVAAASALPEPEPPVPLRPRIGAPAPVTRGGGRRRSLLLGGVLTLVIGLIAVAAFILRDTPRNPPAPGPVAQAPAVPADGAKLGERVGGGPPAAPPAAIPRPQPTARTDSGAAPLAVLYEEDAANPQVPKTTGGRATWRLDAVNAGQGQALESAIRANIDVPEAGFALALVMRRNLDPTLPASHTLELAFVTRAGEPGRIVRDVGLLQFKNDASSRGAPIAGLPVPVRDNLFLIGLSNLPSDMERNLDLLRSRNWIDLPIRMASGQRAIVSFEKAGPGTQVVDDALQQWQGGPARN